jgi:hypothetical protein
MLLLLLLFVDCWLFIIPSFVNILKKFEKSYSIRRARRPRKPVRIPPWEEPCSCYPTHGSYGLSQFSGVFCRQLVRKNLVRPQLRTGPDNFLSAGGGGASVARFISRIQLCGRLLVGYVVTKHKKINSGTCSSYIFVVALFVWYLM